MSEIQRLSHPVECMMFYVTRVINLGSWLSSGFLHSPRIMQLKLSIKTFINVTLEFRILSLKAKGQSTFNLGQGHGISINKHINQFE